MLSHIHIKNYALIKEIDIDLNHGLNIISGETGTGKSIVIQAINMGLGGRGNSSVVAQGAEKAVIQLIFDVSEEEAAGLGEYGSYVEDGQLIITRELGASGRSIARINGEIVTVSVIRAIGSHLVDIHGQYDNQALLSQEKHMDILDSFGGSEVAQVKERLAETFGRYQSLRRELASLRTDHSEFVRRQDFLKYELEEITAADPKLGEDQELEDRRTVLQNAEKIFQGLSQCYSLLYDSGLEQCRDIMSQLSAFGKEYSDIYQPLSEAVYTLKDLQEDIRGLRDEINFTPEEFNETMNRLELLDKLKLKYGGSLDKVLEYKDMCSRQLLENSDIQAREKELEGQLLTLHREVTGLCGELSQARRAAGDRLAKEMTEGLQELNFAQAEFRVDIFKFLNANRRPALTAQGYDRVEFMFNASKGGSLKPLADIASGGEISRIALAFKGITMDIDHISTIVFDEIDTGISGVTASVVGRKMSQIAGAHQILCITHLPQIAAAGDHQYLIARDDTDVRSYTTITRLDRQGRIQELARLLGGTNITDTTLASAQELLDASGYRG